MGAEEVFGGPLAQADFCGNCGSFDADAAEGLLILCVQMQAHIENNDKYASTQRQDLRDGTYELLRFSSMISEINVQSREGRS